MAGGRQLRFVRTIVLDGGTFDTRDASLSLHVYNPIEVTEKGGTINCYQNNFNYRAKLTGIGALAITSTYRSFYFTGDSDASEFTGTINWTETGDWHDGGFSGRASASATATYNLNSAQTYRITYEGSTEETPIAFGALNTVGGSTVNVAKQDTFVAVGAKNEDCKVSGTFTTSRVHLLKKGTAKLTLGSGVTMVAGSTVTVESGELAVGSTNLEASLTIKAGAVLSRYGETEDAKAGAITFEEGAVIDQNLVLTVTSVTGRPTVRVPEGEKRRRMKKTANEDGTITLSTELAKSMVVIVR